MSEEVHESPCVDGMSDCDDTVNDDDWGFSAELPSLSAGMLDVELLTACADAADDVNHALPTTSTMRCTSSRRDWNELV